MKEITLMVPFLEQTATMSPEIFVLGSFLVLTLVLFIFSYPLVSYLYDTRPFGTTMIAVTSSAIISFIVVSIVGTWMGILTHPFPQSLFIS